MKQRGPLETLSLGPFEVTRQGFGCMGFSNTYGLAEDKDSLTTLDRAIGLGINFFDTADIYGYGHNEILLGQAISRRRERLVIATKFGNRLDRDRTKRHLDARPAYVREAVEASLSRLKVEHIDLYYLHRIDPQTPIEDTVGELGRLRTEGKIGAVGLSEVDAPTLRRAHAVQPIAALQSEYSLWSRDVEDEILPTAEALGIRFVAYSPLGRGFLAGIEPAEENDRRVTHPRFQGAAWLANKARRVVIDDLAARLGASAAQVSLAWVLSRGVVPIPGTRQVRHLEANWAANDLFLDADAIAELEAVFTPGSTVGERYPPGAAPVPGGRSI